MKAQASASRPSSAQGARAAARRPSGAAVRMCGHERQARDLANRFVRGERDLGAGIIGAPSAAFDLPASVGRPLPLPLRGELEHAFDADLSAVRIHADVAAAAAARGLGANAFAAGAHLAFAAGRYRPDSEAGRGLIAHEVVHALQQAGRATDGGRLRVVPVSGDGAPQCDDFPDFDVLKVAHAPASDSTSRPAYDGVAQALGKLVASADPKSAIRTYAIGVIPSLKTFKWPHQAESLLYDTCKRYELYEEAAQLIEREKFLGGNRVNTIGLSTGLTAALESRNSGWAVYVKAINAVRWLKDYETAWLVQWEQFTIGNPESVLSYMPRSGEKPGSGNRIYDHFLELHEQLREYKTVSNNEWIYGALTLMHDLDVARFQSSSDIINANRKQAKGPSIASFEEERLRAKSVIAWGADLPNKVQKFVTISQYSKVASISAALKPYLQELGQRVGTIGTKALVIWEKAVPLATLISPPETDDKAAIAALTARRDKAGAIGREQGVSSLLKKVLNDLNKNASDGSRVLDTVGYRDRVKPWLADLDKMAEEKLSAGAAAAFHAGKTDDVLAWIAVRRFVAQVRAHLAYTASESYKTGSGPGRPGVSTIDDVNYQRLFVAGWIDGVAEPLGWSEAHIAAIQILEARLEAKSVLAILTDDEGQIFRRSELSREDLVDKARKDTGGSIIRGMEPLRLDDLALLYQERYYEELTRQLQLRTPGQAAEQDIIRRNAAVPYLIQDARKLVNFEMPQRWEAPGARFAKKDTDARDYATVLREHPAFNELLKKTPPGFYNIVPHEPAGVWAWFVPPFDDIYPVLRQSQFLQLIVAGTFDPGTKPEQRFKLQQGLDETAWIGRLQKTLAEKRKDKTFLEKEWPAIRTELDWYLEAHYTATIRDFRTAFTLAMRLDRQLVAKSMRGWLQRYAADHHDRSAINFAMKELIRFNEANRTLEDGDRETQIGLLMLEIAYDLRKALANEHGFDVIFTFLGFAEVGLGRAQGLIAIPKEQRRSWLPDQENTDDWIRGQLADLRAAVDALRAARDEVQQSRGFKADKDKQEIIPYVKLSSPLPLGTIMQPRYGGFLGDPAAQAYAIAEIKKGFVYNPEYGYAPSRFSAGDPSGYAAARFFEPDGKTELKASDSDVLLEVQVIQFVPPAVQGARPTPRVVKTISLTRAAKDKAIFEDLYNGVTWAGFASAMGNIQAGIESILEFYVDAAELLPGIGPAIAAARIAEAIGEFLVSADYQALLNAAKGGLISVVGGLFDTLTQRVDTDQLILFLLFGDPRLEMVLARSTLGTGKEKSAPEPGGSGGSGKFGVLKKMIDAFRRLGRAVFKAFRKLDRYVERPMQDVRIFASTRRLLSFVLQFTADHIFQILTLAKALATLIAERDNPKASADVLANIEKDLKTEQKDFGLKMHMIVRSIEEFKLPHTVVDISPAIAAVLTMAEAFVIKRTGFVGKVVNLALKHSGVYNLVNTHFAQWLVDEGADPNIYWRNKVLPQIETQFNAARNELVTQLNTVLKSKQFKDVFDPVPEDVPPMKVSADPGETFKETGENYIPDKDEPEIAAAPSQDRPLVPQPAAVPKFGPGQPLSPLLRMRFEQQLGQDLGHVRIHLDPVGQAMTEAFGADALTSGSHVFFRPGKAADTMGHEIVHVVQQTGPRPLGRSHDATPVRGHPERGLDYNPADEAQAREIAAAMRGGGASRLNAGAPRAAGLQPTGINWFTVARMLREISNLKEVTKAAGITEKAGQGVTLAKDIQGGVDKIVAALTDRPKYAALWNPPAAAFTNALKMIDDRLSNPTYSKAIADGAKIIAKEALEPVDAKEGEPRYLSVAEFARHMEAFVLARTGLVVTLKLKGKPVKVPGKDFEAVNLDDPVEKLTLTYVHLPLIDGRSPLWGDVIDHTWDTESAEYKKRVRRVVRPLLESKGIQTGIWPLFGSKYEFSFFFKKEAQDFLKQQAGAVPDPIPAWTEYVKTAKSLSDIVGVRLANYDHPSQKGAGRQSHHLTQYLVADFFANTNEGAAAFDKKRVYPGVAVAGSAVSTALGSASVDTISDKDGGGGHTINVGATKGDGRGAAMPAISLAAVTHQQGKLHVTPEADDIKGGTKKSQGFALSNEFQRQLPAAVTDTNSKIYSDYVTLVGRDEVAKQIYRAAQHTYATVEHHMSTQLEKNMPRLEYQYYCGLVEGTLQDLADSIDETKETQAQKDFREALEKVPAEAKKHNADEMLKFGWNTKG